MIMFLCHLGIVGCLDLAKTQCTETKDKQGKPLHLESVDRIENNDFYIYCFPEGQPIRIK